MGASPFKILMCVLLSLVCGILVDENNNTNPSEESAIDQTYVECIGYFRDGQLEIKITFPKSKRRPTYAEVEKPNKTSILNKCTYLKVVVENASDVNWAQVKKLTMPRLTFLELKLGTNQNISESDFMNQIIWKDLLFFDKPGKDNNIWELGVFIRISLNAKAEFEYDPDYPNEINQSLTVKWFDLTQIIEFLNPTTANKINFGKIHLQNCEVENLDFISTNSLKTLIMWNVEFSDMSKFIQQCTSLEFLSLSLNYKTTIDLAEILTSVNIKTLSIRNGTVTWGNHSNVTHNLVLTSLTDFYMDRCVLDTSFLENVWEFMPNLNLLDMTANYQTVDIGKILTSTSLTYLTLRNARITNPTAISISYNKMYLLRALFLKDCIFEDLPWEVFPVLKYLIVISDFENSTQANPELLKNSLERLLGIKFIHLNLFNWTKSSLDLQIEMSKFLTQTKGDLHGNENGFMLQRIENSRKWRGKIFTGYEENIIEYIGKYKDNIFKIEQPIAPNHIEINLKQYKDKVKKYSYELESYIVKSELEDKFFLSKNPIVLSQFTNTENISLTVDGNILLKFDHVDLGETNDLNFLHNELSLNLLRKASTILKLYEFTPLRKLALKEVSIDDIQLLRCSSLKYNNGTGPGLKQLIISQVRFEEEDVDLVTVVGECGELEELVVHDLPFNLDLGRDFKSKQLKKLSLHGAFVSLTVDTDTDVPTPYGSLEELYIFKTTMYKSFLDNFTKYFPNIRRIGIESGYYPWNSNPTLLKSIVDNFINIEWIYLRNFEWKKNSENDDEAFLEMENFIIATKGELIGNETHFILEKLVSGVWKGRECTDKDYVMITYQSLQMENFYSTFKAHEEYRWRL